MSNDTAGLAHAGGAPALRPRAAVRRGLPALPPAPGPDPHHLLGGLQDRAAGHLGHRVRGERDPGVRHHQRAQVLYQVQQSVQARQEAGVQHSV